MGLLKSVDAPFLSLTTLLSEILFRYLMIYEFVNIPPWIGRFLLGFCFYIVL